MKRFAFRLERLLRLRAREESDKARRLGQALSREEEARRAREAAADHLDRCSMQAGAAEGTVATAGVLRNLGMAVDAAVRLARQAAESHMETEEAVREVQEEYVEARREKRVIERLREREGKDWEEEHSREEQKDFDEIAIQRWNHRGEA